MKNLLALTSLALGLALAAMPAAAQYPAKPVRLIVPFPAGGPSDNAARTIAQAVSGPLGQPVIVENRPGANGAIAAQVVRSAAPDGYTLLWTVGSMGAIPLLQKDAPFESLADFAPVTMVGRFAFGLFVHPSVQAKSVAELVAYAHANPDKLNYASGTLSEHMAAAQLMKAAGVSMVRVPYKGGAQAMPDLVAGRVQVYITPASLGLPHAKDGRVRMLGTLLPQRIASAPDVPTMAEAGMPGVAVPTWQAILAPSQTPRDIVNRISRDVSRALQSPEVRAQFERQTFQIDGSTPEVLAAVIAQEVDAWRQFVRENDVPRE